MQKLNFPFSDIRLRKDEDHIRVYDRVRKKWLVLTPEEWVRQHLILFLHLGKGCPLSLMAVEKSLEYNSMIRRSDVVVYHRDMKPLMLIECKSADVKLSQATFDQAAQYNMTLKVPYLMITNGLEHFCCLIDFDKRTYVFLEDVPLYDEMVLQSQS